MLLKLFPKRYRWCFTITEVASCIRTLLKPRIYKIYVCLSSIEIPSIFNQNNPSLIFKNCGECVFDMQAFHLLSASYLSWSSVMRKPKCLVFHNGRRLNHKHSIAHIYSHRIPGKQFLGNPEHRGEGRDQGSKRAERSERTRRARFSSATRRSLSSEWERLSSSRTLHPFRVTWKIYNECFLVLDSVRCCYGSYGFCGCLRQIMLSLAYNVATIPLSSSLTLISRGSHKRRRPEEAS